MLDQGLTRLEEKGALVRFPDHRFLHREGYTGLKDELVNLLEKMHRAQRLKDTLPKDAPRLQLSWEPADTVYDALLNDLDAEGRIVLDEFTYAMHYGWVDVAEVVDTLQQRRDTLHVIITGRYAPQELIDCADLVTEMKLIKHPYQEQGTRAQQGIEF